MDVIIHFMSETYRNITELTSEMRARFDKYFSKGRLSGISVTDVPEESFIRLYEILGGHLVIPQFAYSELVNNPLFVVNHDSGGKTYITSGVKSYLTDTKPIEQTIVLQDVNENGDEKGHGSIKRILMDPGYLNEPYVGYSETETQYQRQGLGVRRLLLMNALTQSFFNLPLYSMFANDSAQKVWNKLVKEGTALQINSNGFRNEYRFKE